MMRAAMKFRKGELQAEPKLDTILVVKKTKGKQEIRQVLPLGGIS
jgi:hypothetical protein